MRSGSTWSSLTRRIPPGSLLAVDACTPPAPHVEITGKKREQRRPGCVLPPARLEGYHLGRCLRPSRCRNYRLRPAHPGPTSFHGPRHREKSGVSAGLGGGAAWARHPGGVRAPRPSLPPACCGCTELCAVVPVCRESTRAHVRAPSSLEGRRLGHGWPVWVGLACVAPGDS
nr:single-pass membrane and coiled-coil domain-containing protein 4 isoform X1 [Ovis aries]XP_042094330.1 single-pass membrane and coiled-coil domain-containing protein 4 isoform X1 [Ovis aries]